MKINLDQMPVSFDTSNSQLLVNGIPVVLSKTENAQFKALVLSKLEIPEPVKSEMNGVVPHSPHLEANKLVLKGKPVKTKPQMKVKSAGEKVSDAWTKRKTERKAQNLCLYVDCNNRPAKNKRMCRVHIKAQRDARWGK